jgi:hypothetical protein
MTHSLRAAYEHTTYWVDARPFPIAVRVGARNRALDRLLHAHRVRHWAFITACNPGSKPKPYWYNAARTRRLTQLMRVGRWRAIPALAEGDRGDWPIEEGLLALRLAPARARRLGRAFHQNAVLAGRRGTGPDLLWC